MTAKALVRGVFDAPKPHPAPPPTGLVNPTVYQIRAAKQHIVEIGLYQAYLQTHRDALEAQLAALDPADVSAVHVPGYPVPQTYK
jgi:hypothetical protein